MKAKNFFLLTLPLLSGILCGCQSQKIEPPHRGSSLIAAIDEGNSDRVKELIAQGANVNKPDAAGVTPLGEASLWNRTDIMLFLLHKEALVNATMENDGTPLQYAAAMGNTEAVRILLQHGADVEGDRASLPPLMAAVDNGIEIERGYPGAGKPVELLDLEQVLLAHGADVNAKRNGRSALSIARERHLPRTIKLLKNAGAKA